MPQSCVAQRSTAAPVDASLLPAGGRPRRIERRRGRAPALSASARPGLDGHGRWCELHRTWYGEIMRRQPMDLMQGTLDVLVLRTLLAGPMHGYAVSRWIRERTDGMLAIEDAPLYKALHRLERAGWVDAEWGLSENNRRARYYRLTSRGRQRLRSEESSWRRYVEAVFKVLEPG